MDQMEQKRNCRKEKWVARQPTEELVEKPSEEHHVGSQSLDFLRCQRRQTVRDDPLVRSTNCLSRVSSLDSFLCPFRFCPSVSFFPPSTDLGVLIP